MITRWLYHKSTKLLKPSLCVFLQKYYPTNLCQTQLNNNDIIPSSDLPSLVMKLAGTPSHKALCCLTCSHNSTRCGNWQTTKTCTLKQSTTGWRTQTKCYHVSATCHLLQSMWMSYVLGTLSTIQWLPIGRTLPILSKRSLDWKRPSSNHLIV